MNLINLRSKVNIGYSHRSNTYQCHKTVRNDFNRGKSHKYINKIKWKRRDHSDRKQIKNAILYKHFLKRIKRRCVSIVQKIFEKKGEHTRAAVSVNSLPLGVAVEVDAIFELN